MLILIKIFLIKKHLYFCVVITKLFMSGFVLKEIEAIKGCKHDFYKLEIDGSCSYDEFEDKIRSTQQYYSEFTTLLAYAQFFADGKRLPEKNWHRCI